MMLVIMVFPQLREEICSFEHIYACWRFFFIYNCTILWNGKKITDFKNYSNACHIGLMVLIFSNYKGDFFLIVEKWSATPSTLVFFSYPLIWLKSEIRMMFLRQHSIVISLLWQLAWTNNFIKACPTHCHK